MGMFFIHNMNLLVKWQNSGWLYFYKQFNLLLNSLIIIQIQYTHSFEMDDKEPKPKKFQPHFPTTKIKKIIQENPEIGKISNLVPPLIEQSLEFFLIDLLKKCQEVAQEHNINKLTPPVLKKALKSLPNYDFIKDALDDVQDLVEITLTKTKSATPRQPKRPKPETQAKQQKQKQKKGRKKQKVQGESVEPISVEEQQ